MNMVVTCQFSILAMNWYLMLKLIAVMNVFFFANMILALHMRLQYRLSMDGGTVVNPTQTMGTLRLAVFYLIPFILGP